MSEYDVNGILFKNSYEMQNFIVIFFLAQILDLLKYDLHVNRAQNLWKTEALKCYYGPLEILKHLIFPSTQSVLIWNENISPLFGEQKKTMIHRTFKINSIVLPYCIGWIARLVFFSRFIQSMLKNLFQIHMECNIFPAYRTSQKKIKRFNNRTHSVTIQYMRVFWIRIFLNKKARL